MTDENKILKFRLKKYMKHEIICYMKQKKTFNPEKKFI